MSDGEAPSARYRRLAQECRATARTVSSEETRFHLLAMADVWERLAEQHSHSTDLSKPSAPDSEQLVMQQQQQVQPEDDDNKD